MRLLLEDDQHVPRQGFIAMFLSRLPTAASLAVAFLLAACAGPSKLVSPVTPGSHQDFVANVGDRVFFETDSTDLTPTAAATLDQQAQWLNRYPHYTFILEGHADERGTREYNFSLAARRAQSVRDYLVARGTSASRFRVVSYGKERPVAVCNDLSCWAQNRRAVTVLAAGAGS